MLILQIQKAYSLNKSAIFISIEGKRKQWLNRFLSEAKKENKNWRALPGFYKVAPGDDISCWQNVILLPFNKGYKFEFPHISEKKWDSRFR